MIPYGPFTCWFSYVLVVAERTLFIPPYTPEMNPIEQIWKELRARGFCNEIFASLEKVVDRLCETINHLAKEKIISITKRNWISNIFIED